MMAMDEWAGRLDQRVCFERRSTQRGVAGDWSGQWEQVAECWAAVRLLSRLNQSVVTAETLHSARRWRIELRSGPTLQVGMRLVWRGQNLRVAGVEDDPSIADRLVVIAEEFAA